MFCICCLIKKPPPGSWLIELDLYELFDEIHQFFVGIHGQDVFALVELQRKQDVFRQDDGFVHLDAITGFALGAASVFGAHHDRDFPDGCQHLSDESRFAFQHAVLRRRKRRDR
jgi:hypothetical protein